MKSTVIFLVSILCGVLFATDVAPIQALEGTYPVLRYKDNPRATGLVRISIEQNDVGFSLIPLALSSYSVPDKRVATPIEATVVTESEKTVVQTFDSQEKSTNIRYAVEDGYLTISAKNCVAERPCVEEEVVLSRGKAPGIPIGALEFGKRMAGKYHIETAGGVAPKPENSTSMVLVNGPRTIIMAAYCPPGAPACDPGYLFLNDENSSIFERKISETLTLYDIFYQHEEALWYYRWEEGKDFVTYKNTQYVFQEKTLCLEHNLKRERIKVAIY